MKYSGIKFYPQSGISFNISYINYDNFYTAEFDFLSSNSNNTKLVIESGKIKDKNKDFIYFVDSKNKFFNISGNLSDKNFNLSINNNTIYSANDNYGFCSGINLSWDGSVNFEKDLDVQVNGDVPLFSFDYKRVDYYLNPISLKISGSENNLFPFFINKIEINELSAASENFYFSGENQNFEVPNGGYKELVIIQKDPYNSYFLPISIDTNFGKISQILPILRFSNPPESGFLTINSSIAAGSEFTLDTLSLYSKWNFVLDIYSAQSKTSGYYITISGLENNNIFKNGYQDSFTGSWLAAKNRDNTVVSFNFDILISEVNLSDNTNNRQQIYSINNEAHQAQLGYYGRVFNPSGIPEFHKKYWNVTGITVNVFKSGVPTGLRPFIPANSGLSGSSFPPNTLLAGQALRNNPSGSLYLSIYEGNNFTGSLNGFEKIYESVRNFTGLAATGTSGQYFTFNTTNLEFNYKNQYVVLFSGNASGYFSGTLTGITGEGLTGQIPLYFKDNLYLSSGSSNYNENNNLISSGIFGNPDSGFNFYTDKNIALNIGCTEIYDRNQITGYLKTFPFLNYQSHNIMIEKQIEFNNSFEFLGKAMYIISGTNNTLYSGLLFADEDIYRQLRANYTLIEEKY
jgi:hypothetical protein